MRDRALLGSALFDGASSLICFDLLLSSHIPFTEPSFLARLWVPFLLACFHLIAHHVGISSPNVPTLVP